ncbi:hypothetical protein [Niabella hibiscisoli]|nr:hypothetical protein [Niabella hibiscisoli]MCH5715123.1 hypothetical protein [Niabella hibiscisoli]
MKQGVYEMRKIIDLRASMHFYAASYRQDARAAGSEREQRCCYLKALAVK